MSFTCIHFFSASQQNIHHIKYENKDFSILWARIQSVQICNIFNYFKYFITHCRLFHNVQYFAPLCIQIIFILLHSWPPGKSHHTRNVTLYNNVTTLHCNTMGNDGKRKHGLFSITYARFMGRFKDSIIKMYLFYCVFIIFYTYINNETERVWNNNYNNRNYLSFFIYDK